MNVLYQSERFTAWLASLKDLRAKFKILARIRRAELGNFCDSKPVGAGVFEMRVHFGPGYRLYCMRRGDCIYLRRAWIWKIAIRAARASLEKVKKIT